MVLLIPIFASSAFVPTSTMPGWVRTVAANQPMTEAIDAVRALLLGTAVGTHPELAVAWFAGILVVAFLAAAFLFSQAASRL
jgi:ABC-type polysaccharide/polyol phosphate export permease